ncbi:glycosyltransferase [Ciceribacter sp. L1K22]|nr:glycosyltransferase family 2 protein [Ciceribacter sp. L1K22]MBO3758459.1 glycosyltransferase [Ciceribacter sp. L1K22]
MAPGPEVGEFPEDSAECRILKRLGFSKPAIAAAADNAARRGTTIEQELLATGWIREEAYYAALARLAGLPFVDALDPEAVMDVEGMDVLLQRPTMLRVYDRRRAPSVAIIPQAGRMENLLDSIAAMPTLSKSLVVTTPSAMRAAVWKAGETRRALNVSASLFERQPRFSARIVMTGLQGFVLGAASAGAGLGLALFGGPVLLALHASVSSFYLAALALRGGALLYAIRELLPIDRHTPDEDLPVYTVIVALYREAPVAAQLLKALDRLDWPKSRLDVKLVCEADDRDTIDALRALRPGPHCEIVEVPPIGPRTKPKALSYVLGAARGEYVAVYDAEDRPHPLQLREACHRFRHMPDKVACLQAPLIISNAQASWVSALFAVEYAGLFRGLLPVLARLRMPLPLGGTSNHFRTRILREVGGWDPYNVTEDADLGLRLYRLGYRCGVLRRQTLEDAPTEMGVWMRQRTRWFKGWLQTWLVVMRDGGRARREMGLLAYVVFHLLVGGMLLSALLHPVMLITVLSSVFAMLGAPRPPLSLLQVGLIAVDIVNVLGAYACFLGLGAVAMIGYEKRLIGWRWLAVPLYWMMMAAAAWRAVYELRRRPFHWAKTPHKPVVMGQGASSTEPPQKLKWPRLWRRQKADA